MTRNVKQQPKAGEQSVWDEVASLKRGRILEEAAALICERGFHGTTIDDIAERFGATKPFVYYHFESKVALLVALCQHGALDALNAINRASSAPGTPRERLDQFVRDFAAHALENQKYVTIYFREGINLPKADSDRINRMRKEIDRKLTLLLEEGVRAGEFAIDDPGLCCLVIAGMISYAFAWHRREGRLHIAEICDKMSNLVLNMVKKS